MVRKALARHEIRLKHLERILEMFMRTRSNKDFIAAVKRSKVYLTKKMFGRVAFLVKIRCNSSVRLSCHMFTTSRRKP